jgi:hypothetical protein
VQVEAPKINNCWKPIGQELEATYCKATGVKEEQIVSSKIISAEDDGEEIY